MSLIVLTGPGKSGKSTSLRQSLSQVALSCSGFMTERRMTDDGMGFALIPISCGAADAETFMSISAKGVSFDYDHFRTRVQASCRDTALVVCDELGGLELLDDAFYERFLARVSGPQPHLVVFKSQQNLEKLLRKSALTAAAKELLFERRAALLAVADSFLSTEEAGDLVLRLKPLLSAIGET